MVRHKQLLKPMKNLKNIADPLKYLSLTLLMNLSDLIYKIIKRNKTVWFKHVFRYCSLLVIESCNLQEQQYHN